ncbi:hypothetical protein IPJ72_02500 [Candidatus Peregrinibacteria bacterium]|nr:MAG: hypothetical protein IPJ72_02500 [Candidatus Peregrinibacteria bacterium]
MTNRTNCIDRAGQILIFCIWIEKRLVDLIVLKKHPRLIKKVNESSAKINLPRTFVVERAKLWQKDFSVIKDMFINLFDPPNDWRNNLEGIYDWRNIIGHSHISLYRGYLLYRPSGKRRKINRLTKNHIVSRPPDAAKPFLMTLKLSDDKKYESVLAVLEEFDQKYLKFVANSLGINYEKIR